jgi:hypothetical protein
MAVEPDSVPVSIKALQQTGTPKRLNRLRELVGVSIIRYTRAPKSLHFNRPSRAEFDQERTNVSAALN